MPSAGPHKMRECLPLIVMLRNRLKYALTYRECKMICMQRLIKVDGKTRSDMFFPAGFMDVVNIDKMLDYIKFEVGNLVMINGGNNQGRVGTIAHRERHPGSFEMVHIKDAVGHTFATRLQNVFVIGKGTHPYISLPKGNGIKLSIIENRSAKMAK